MKQRICKDCSLTLESKAFTSSRARICKQCKVLKQLRQQKEMQQRAIERLKTKKQKTKEVVRISDLKKEVQKVFNKFIRLRDKDEMCISCGRECGKWDAGHYIAQGSTGALRYNEDNVHKQGTGCNRFKHGNLLEYRIKLVKKIGIDRVEWLENHRNDVKRWQREELIDLQEMYKQKIKELES